MPDVVGVPVFRQDGSATLGQFLQDDRVQSVQFRDGGAYFATVAVSAGLEVRGYI